MISIFCLAIASLNESNDKLFNVKIFSANGELLSQIEASQVMIIRNVLTGIYNFFQS